MSIDPSKSVESRELTPFTRATTNKAIDRVIPALKEGTYKAMGGGSVMKAYNNCSLPVAILAFAAWGMHGKFSQLGDLNEIFIVQLFAVFIAMPLVALLLKKSSESIKLSSGLSHEKLDEKVFQAALDSGKIPNQFIDPITLDVIKRPVGFFGDDSATIVDYATAIKLLEKGTHPLTRKEIKFDQLLDLPEIKKQIDQFVERWKDKLKEEELD